MTNEMAFFILAVFSVMGIVAWGGLFKEAEGAKAHRGCLFVALVLVFVGLFVRLAQVLG